MNFFVAFCARLLLSFVLLSCLVSCSSHQQKKLAPQASDVEKKQQQNQITRAQIKRAIGQKLMLDLRYYCGDNRGNTQNINTTHLYNGRCQKPLTELPKALADMIRDSQLGGVILFADNLSNIEQTVTLTHDLQQAALTSNGQVPLFISVDQEGGRVARLPRQLATSFSGNMAIGATYQQHGVKFAKETGEVLAKELFAAGFNVNHAPSVDVNVNPENPVINVRSFGESAEAVAKLGVSQLNAMQSQQVIATLKHFPGHGDTNVDSHTGLPRVNHSIDKIRAVDLAPFQYAIDNSDVAMIMTAHIQYPALDASTFVSKTGQSMIKPATMSRTILTDILRNEMGYQGLVITDALDMQGISRFFSEQQAVLETFKAGADIALMPIKIRFQQDINQLFVLIDELTDATLAGMVSKTEIMQSYQRIIATKQRFITPYLAAAPTLDSKITTANMLLGNKQHRVLEQNLANNAITAIKGSGQLSKGVKRILAFMPDNDKCAALHSAFAVFRDKQMMDKTLTCKAYYDISLADAKTLVAAHDAAVISNLTPRQSLAEMGGMDDLPLLKKQLGNLAANKRRQDYVVKQLLIHGRKLNKELVFVSLRMPFEAKQYQQWSDHVLATYSYNQYTNANGVSQGAAYQALINLLLGQITAQGNLPVSLTP